MFTGIDTAARLTAAQAAKIKPEGISFIGRYLIPEQYGNALTAKEAQTLRDAGLAIMLCWEIDAQAMKRGAEKGAEHGAKARQLAEKLGVPAGTAIYFAADWDVQQRDLLACESYLSAAQAALGKYRVGAYGGERLVAFLADRGLPIALWQCCAWTNTFCDAAAVLQYAWQGSTDAKEMAAKLGFAVDLDSCEDMRAAGLWLPEEAGETQSEATIPQSASQTDHYTQGGHDGAAWYAEAMTWAAAQGLLRDGRPNDPVTRAELAMVLYRIYGPSDDKRDSGMLSE